MKNNIPDDIILFEPDASFKNICSNSWLFLHRVLSANELKVAHYLSMIAKDENNSLEPLNDKVKIEELMTTFNLSKNMVKPILNKLFNLGVYGKFETVDFEKGYTNYWIFNPYLSFSGKMIKSEIASLFKNTHCAKAFYDSEYKIQKSKK